MKECIKVAWLLSLVGCSLRGALTLGLLLLEMFSQGSGEYVVFVKENNVILLHICMFFTVQHCQATKMKLGQRKKWFYGLLGPVNVETAGIEVGRRN